MLHESADLFVLRRRHEGFYHSTQQILLSVFSFTFNFLHLNEGMLRRVAKEYFEYREKGLSEVPLKKVFQLRLELFLYMESQL